MPVNLASIDHIALLLYTIYLGAILGGTWMVWRSPARQRIWGFVLLMEAAGAVALLTLMSTKYWNSKGVALINIGIASILWDLVSVFVPLTLGTAVVFATGYLTNKLTRKQYLVMGPLLPCLLIPIIFAISTKQLISVSEPTELPEVVSTGTIEIAPGFRLTTYKNEPALNPTSITFGPDNNLYIANYNGDIWGISTEDGTSWRYATGIEIPKGLAWHNDLLYVASHGKVSIIHDNNGDNVGDEVEDIITDLPAGVYHWHANNGLVFGPDGRMYFAVGSTTDHSIETYQYGSSIVSAEADGSDLRVYAVGVRNPYRLAFNSRGDLFATDNGPNELEPAPGDELNQIVEGGDYGFPAEFGVPLPGSKAQAPVALFPPHASADGLVFYQGDQFPEEYFDDAFVTLLHRGQIYRVQFHRDANGSYTTRLSLFVTGLKGPLDIAVGPDGSLYVMDFITSIIYKIDYVGENG